MITILAQDIYLSDDTIQLNNCLNCNKGLVFLDYFYCNAENMVFIGNVVNNQGSLLLKQNFTAIQSLNSRFLALSAPSATIMRS